VTPTARFDPVERNRPGSIDTPDPDTDDVLDTDDADALRIEILRLRDLVAGASAREEVLDDRVAELEAQVEELAAEIEKLARVTANPAVRALLAVTRPARRYLERRRGGS
jgi:hypothetical protein